MMIGAADVTICPKASETTRAANLTITQMLTRSEDLMIGLRLIKAKNRMPGPKLIRAESITTGRRMIKAETAKVKANIRIAGLQIYYGRVPEGLKFSDAPATLVMAKLYGCLK